MDREIGHRCSGIKSVNLIACGFVCLIDFPTGGFTLLLPNHSSIMVAVCDVQQKLTHDQGHVSHEPWKY